MLFERPEYQKKTKEEKDELIDEILDCCDREDRLYYGPDDRYEGLYYSEE